MTAYDDVSARARGLGTHLLATGEWAALAESSDWPALSAHLKRARDPLLLRGPADAASVERAVRQRAGERLALLARWCGNRRPLLDVIFGDEDRRSLRALVRGAAAGAAPEARLALTIPTPALPLRALETLATQQSIAAVAALLVVWRHPAATALQGVPKRGPPDLLLLDAALTREFASRAVAAGHQADADLRWHVRTLLDQENVLGALACADSPAEVEFAALFVEGGSIDLVALEQVARARGHLAAVRRAQALFRRTALEAAFSADEPSRLAERMAAAHRAYLHRASRTRPLGSAPVLDYALRLREEVNRFQKLAWALALEAPRAFRLGEVDVR